MLGSVEKAITERVVKTALDCGYLVGVDSQDGTELDPCHDINEILNTCFNYDDVVLVLDNCYNQSKPYGRILFVFDNDGIEIISDYSISLNEFIQTLSFKGLVIDLEGIL
jgi:hypothetical protein